MIFKILPKRKCAALERSDRIDGAIALFRVEKEAFILTLTTNLAEGKFRADLYHIISDKVLKREPEEAGNRFHLGDGRPDVSALAAAAASAARRAGMGIECVRIAVGRHRGHLRLVVAALAKMAAAWGVGVLFCMATIGGRTVKARRERRRQRIMTKEASLTAVGWTKRT